MLLDLGRNNNFFVYIFKNQSIVIQLIMFYSKITIHTSKKSKCYLQIIKYVSKRLNMI